MADIESTFTPSLDELLERIDDHLRDHGGRLLRTQSRLNQIEADLQGVNEKLDRVLAILDPS